MEATPILILVYNGWDMVFSNLKIISSHFANIFVIDNNSEKHAADEIRIFFPNIRYLRLDQNYGWAGGYNRALKKIYLEGHKAVFILNSDAVVNSESVRSAVDGLGERIAAVGSIILEDEGSLVVYDGTFNINRSPKSINEVDPGRLPVKSVHGAAFALNLDAYQKIGPFYEPYFLYHEETDWCSEAKKKGYDILVDGKSFCYHKGSASATTANKEYYMTRNTFIALRRGTALAGVPNTWIGFTVQGLRLPNKNNDLASARADGLLDGIFGKSGKRRSRWNPIVRTVLILTLRLLLIPTRAFIKMTK
jgi:GT2 family glycosyltransferase